MAINDKNFNHRHIGKTNAATSKAFRLFNICRVCSANILEENITGFYYRNTIIRYDWNCEFCFQYNVSVVFGNAFRAVEELIHTIDDKYCFELLYHIPSYDIFQAGLFNYEQYGTANSKMKLDLLEDTEYYDEFIDKYIDDEEGIDNLMLLV